jgi:hypothetical protein
VRTIHFSGKRLVLNGSFVLILLLACCTKLDEKFNGDLTSNQVASGNANTAALLNGVYSAMEDAFVFPLNTWALNELPTDAAIAPTRGQDWDDNGTWRALHQHSWNSLNPKIAEVFKKINGVSFLATDMLQYNPTPEQQAQARFLRAYAMYFLLDLFNQVPYRDPGESLLTEARVRKGLDALDYIVSEINAVEPMLAGGPPYVANKYAARALLMKIYLNKAVYENRADPTFKAEDMNKVISLADEIINSGKYKFSDQFFDNFAPSNTVIGKENIFTQFHEGGASANDLVFMTFVVTMHYANTPGGANGFTTLSDFYDRFELSDKRRGIHYITTGTPPNPGNRVNIGFLAEQQYNLFDDTPLSYGSGQPLAFTREVKNIELGSNLEVTGIRALKYEPDWNNLFDPDNDYVFFRLSDVLLMKAEAIMRGGTATPDDTYGNDALSIVNTIRTDPARGASAFTSINLDQLLEERGRELWWEGWRRQDMIRFGTFLKNFQEKEYLSDPKYLVFPIPEEQLAVNHILVQNPGY